MKKYKKTLRYFIFGLLFLGCQEDFLQENPTSIIDPAALLTDKAGAEIYTVGAYDAARNCINVKLPNRLVKYLGCYGC